MIRYLVFLEVVELHRQIIEQSGGENSAPSLLAERGLGGKIPTTNFSGNQ